MTPALFRFGTYHRLNLRLPTTPDQKQCSELTVGMIHAAGLRAAPRPPPHDRTKRVRVAGAENPTYRPSHLHLRTYPGAAPGALNDVRLP